LWIFISIIKLSILHKHLHLNIKHSFNFRKKNKIDNILFNTFSSLLRCHIATHVLWRTLFLLNVMNFVILLYVCLLKKWPLLFHKLEIIFMFLLNFVNFFWLEISCTNVIMFGKKKKNIYDGLLLLNFRHYKK